MLTGSSQLCPRLLPPAPTADAICSTPQGLVFLPTNCPVQPEPPNLVPHLPEGGSVRTWGARSVKNGLPLSPRDSVGCSLNLCLPGCSSIFPQITAFYSSLQRNITFGPQGQARGVRIRPCTALPASLAPLSPSGTLSCLQPQHGALLRGLRTPLRAPCPRAPTAFLSWRPTILLGTLSPKQHLPGCSHHGFSQHPVRFHSPGPGITYL